MAKKLLVARLGAGSITVALCAALPGCNLMIRQRDDCVGQPSRRGESVVVCQNGDADADGADADGARDATPDGTGDATADTTGDGAGDGAKDHVSGDQL